MPLDFEGNLYGNDHILHDTHVVQWGKLKIVEIVRGLKDTLSYMEELRTLSPMERQYRLLLGRKGQGHER
jgi:hypothetical protein